jgi:polyisoprenoid-binding protein YceI
MKNKIILCSLVLCAAAKLSASPLNFDFKDPKGVNNVIFKLDAPLESINGTASGISGQVAFDPENPGAVKGKIVVATVSMHLGNPMQKEHLHGDMWMNVAKFPEITFETAKVQNVKTQENVTTAEVTGTLTIKGVAKTITVPVKMTYLKDRLKDRTGKPGDLLVLRANFSIKRRDFGINGGQMEEKVSDEIELNFSIAGAAAR